MKKILLIETFFLAFFAFTASADFGFTPLAPIPTLSQNTAINLGVYMRALFTALVGLAVVFSVFQLVIGGIQYITADVISSKESGRKRITSALIGLILILSSWVILNTVNPELLSTGLNIHAINVPDPGGPNNRENDTISDNMGGSGSGPVIEGGSNQKVDAATNLLKLKNAGVIATMDNVNGMREKTINTLVALKSGCQSCLIRITPHGGTNGDHNTGTYSHGNGYKVDIAANQSLNAYITSISTSVGVRSDGAQIYQDKTNPNITYNYESNGNGGWWDTVVK